VSALSELDTVMRTEGFTLEVRSVGTRWRAAVIVDGVEVGWTLERTARQGVAVMLDRLGVLEDVDRWMP
jgi:hypothetical protein